jgi:hypothetical protein
VERRRALFVEAAVKQRRGKMRIALAAVLAAAVSTSALAQTQYYVVQDVKTKRCTIVDKKPTTTTEVTVLGNTVYKSRTEAEAGMKTVKVCTSN